jgi:hypothetical protein
LKAKIAKRAEKPGTDWKREYERVEAQRQRVVRTLLALRALKSLVLYPEPAIRHVRLELLNLPWRMADQVLFEDVDTARKMLQLEAWRILEEFEGRLAAGDRQPVTPLNARYMQADGELQYGDLELEQQ